MKLPCLSMDEHLENDLWTSFINGCNLGASSSPGNSHQGLNITFLARDPYELSLATAPGRGEHPKV